MQIFQDIHEPDLYRTKQDTGQQPSHTQLHVTDGLTMQDKLDNHVVGFCKVLVIELLTSQLQEAWKIIKFHHGIKVLF